VTAKVPFGAVRPLGEACLRLVRRAAAAAETRRGAGVVFVVALLLWWLEALVIPLGPGRDLGTYLGAYIQLFQEHPIDLGFVLGRTPISSLVVGGLLQFARGRLAEPAVSLLYAGSILAWFLAARRFGGKAALLTVVALLLYPGYGILFHELSSDAVFAAAFAGWSLLVIRTLLSPTARGFALAGAGVGVLVLIRPGNQVLLVLALVPLLVCATWRARLVSAAAFLVPAVVLIAGWAVHNGIRYDNYTIARGGNATVPFYRAFVTDRIVRPSNGPASRELTRAVERDLLPKEPYRSYGITLSDFFHDASPRMQVDLLALSDRLKGWHSNYRWLRDVGVEAVRTHPARYTGGVIGSTWGMLTLGLYRNGVSNASQGGTTTAGSRSEGRPTIVSGGKTLPEPTEGEPIPSAHEGGVSTPDNSIYTVWTSPTEHHLVFVHPGGRARYDALHRRMDELAANLPHRSGSPSLALRLNQSSRWFVPPALWLAIGIVLLAFRRPRNALALSVPTVAGLLVIVLTALGLPAEPHYSVPVAPAFVLLTGTALFAPGRAASRVATSELRAPALRLAGIGLGAIAGLWAAKHYVSELRDLVASSYAPHDLAVFLGAAAKVLHGASPYAYPPLLAFLISPLHPLDPGIAGLLWTLICLACVMGALWLLEVRDWRCFALTGAFLFTRSAVDLGTVGPLLLLAVAAAWHWRERLVEPAAAIAAGIALKLFLWPLVLWPALMRRTRTSVASVGFALALVLVPWAVIGFAGLSGYVHVLHRLSDEEATSSYSVIALAVRAHLPEAAGVVLSIIAAVSLVLAAGWIARDERRARRDRDVAVLTLVLAAALAASPIVWVHYFLLLLVPLALTRPRLSLLWFVPFAYSWVGEAGWPAGNATWLGVALAATLVILGGSLLQALRFPTAHAEPRAAAAQLRLRSPGSTGSADRAKA
jgi:hypothetical protein